MIFVERRPLETVDDVRRALQRAIEIEHSTIPPYLVALYSLDAEKNAAIHAILSDVVAQEMGHLALAANILVALGGTPRFTTPGFVPSYPEGVPMKIGDRDGHKLVLHLEPFSVPLIRDTFMIIESPQDALQFPTAQRGTLFDELAVDEEHFHTIGDFYAKIKLKLEDLGEEAFVGRDRPQPCGAPAGVFAIRSLSDALRAIDFIVQQGEGTNMTPLAGGNTVLAHYYRLEEIVEGLTLVPAPDSPKGFIFSQPPIPFDPTGVVQIIKDAKVSQYPAGSMAMRLAQQFDKTYASMLRALEGAFAGHPEALTGAIGLMFDLMICAGRLVQTPLGGGNFAAPTFELETLTDHRTNYAV